jgi:glycosyltransferase involved in cell wall biosynthesis
MINIMSSTVIIYVLCSNTEKLTLANSIYTTYWWAKPILLKYQDYTLENSFWKQLDEIQHEWDNYDMVGTIAYSAFKKINIQQLDEIINNKLYFPNQYYHFMDSNVPIPNCNTNKHPQFMTIWNDMLCKLNLQTTTENNCNYWMCSTLLMKRFIVWHTTICLPALIEHPLSFEDAGYKSTDYNNIITEQKLIQIWGKPYYPYIMFILERLNKCFFETYYPEQVEKRNNFCWEFYTNNNSDLKPFNKVQAKHHYYKYGQFERRICYNGDNEMTNEMTRYNNLLPKMVFLISHAKEIGGAQQCLSNLEKIYAQKGILTEMLYLQDITNLNIIEYILNKANANNCCPVVFCNTLCCYNIIYKLSKTNILTYWYIHEWYDSFTQQFFKNYISDHSIFNSSIKLIFVCNASLSNYTNYIPIITNQHIIYNTYSCEYLNNRINDVQHKIIKQNDIIYLAIIGTIEQRKNQQAFIDNVFYKLKDKYSNVKLLIVGRVAKKLGIIPTYVNDIIVVGVVDNALPFITMSDIVISYAINEVLPLNIIESCYCGKPVVSSNVGGINEIITDNYDGYLFETNDHDKCFNILCNLIENKELRDNVGNNAKNTFFNKFDEKHVIQKVLSLLDYN